MTDEEAQTQFMNESSRINRQNMERQLRRMEQNMIQSAMLDMVTDQIKMNREAQQKLSQAAGA